MYHLLNQNPKRPPVYRLAMALVHNNLRCDLLRRATQCLRLGGAVLGEPEISDLQVAVTVDQHVLGLEVALDDVLAVQVFEDECGLGSLVACFHFVETVDRAEVGEEFAALNKLKEYLEVLVILGLALVVDDEGVVDVGHYKNFIFDMFDLLRFD